MKKLFSDLLSLEGIKGIFLISEKNVDIVKTSPDVTKSDIMEMKWYHSFKELGNTTEMEFVYPNDRIYMRNTESGILIIWTGAFTSSSMVRIHCNLVVDSLEQYQKTGKVKRLFSRK